MGVQNFNQKWKIFWKFTFSSDSCKVVTLICQFQSKYFFFSNNKMYYIIPRLSSQWDRPPFDASAILLAWTHYWSSGRVLCYLILEWGIVIMKRGWYSFDKNAIPFWKCWIVWKIDTKISLSAKKKSFHSILSYKLGCYVDSVATWMHRDALYYARFTIIRRRWSFYDGGWCWRRRWWWRRRPTLWRRYQFKPPYISRRIWGCSNKYYPVCSECQICG